MVESVVPASSEHQARGFVPAVGSRRRENGRLRRLWTFWTAGLFPPHEIAEFPAGLDVFGAGMKPLNQARKLARPWKFGALEERENLCMGRSKWLHSDRRTTGRRSGQRTAGNNVEKRSKSVGLKSGLNRVEHGSGDPAEGRRRRDVILTSR